MQLNEIKSNVKEVISYSQGIENPKVDELIDNWYQAKKDIIALFGGKLIYTFPEKVVFHLDEREKKARLSEFIASVEDRWDNVELADFIAKFENNFFENLTFEDYVVPSSGKVITKGTKIIKAFKFFEEDKIVLDDLQTQASMLIQDDKVEGYLSFSVHPLDYLSSSENNYNWRSCHSLDGEYRAGNLSYMLDSSTIVVYLSSKEQTTLPNFPDSVPWNSKKWRVLFFLSNDWNMLFAGRQYPFASKHGINIVLNYFSKLFDTTYYKCWEDYRIGSVNLNANPLPLVGDYVPVGRTLIALNQLITDAKPTLHYNDLLYSTVYKPIYAYSFEKNYHFSPPTGTTNSETKFFIGGVPKCLRCGKEEVVDSGTMQCQECLDIYGQDTGFERCDCCGHNMRVGDGYWVDDFYVCPDCYEKETAICEDCEERHFIENMKYDAKNHLYICKRCLKENK